MTFRLSIDLGNDSFLPDPAFAVSQLLVDVAMTIDKRASLPLASLAIIDLNGNGVGSFGVSVE